MKLQMLLLLSGILASCPATSSSQNARPAPSQPSLAAGRSALSAGNHAAAETIFRKITAKQPGNLVAWHLLALTLHSSGRPEEAVPAYIKASVHPRLAPSANYNLACAHSLAGRIDASLKALEQAWRAGYRDLKQARADQDLTLVRADTRFAPLLKRLQAELVAFNDGTRIIHEIHGENAGDQFGWVAGGAGDVDADGVRDFIVGAPNVSQNRRPHGAIYVYSGKTGTLLFKKLGRAGDHLGYGVDQVGDLDGDGHCDVIGGAPSTQQGGPGRAYVFSGKTGTQLAMVAGDNAGDRFGVEASGVGDFDGDGINDYLVGAERHDNAGKDAGRLVIFSGKTHKPITTLDGEVAGDQFGRAAEGLFRNGSGLLVVGAPKAGPTKRGRAYVYRKNSTTSPLRKLAILDADKTGGAFGEMFVSIPGDLNGDQTPDIYVSDWRNRARGSNTGRIYLYSGKDGASLGSITGKAGEGFGIGKAEAGDVDGDGIADLIVGAWQNSDLAPSGGKAYLISGKTRAAIKTFTCRTPGDTFGFDATGLGDINADGAPDFLITSADSSIKGRQSGRVFVISGKL